MSSNQCPLLAQSGHERVRCTCPLLGVKRTSAGAPLNVEIKVKLIGMRPQRNGINLAFPLVTDPSLDDILGEYIPAEQKRMIGLECIECLLQRAGRGLHYLRFRGR